MSKHLEYRGTFTNATSRIDAGCFESTTHRYRDEYRCSNPAKILEEEIPKDDEAADLEDRQTDGHRVIHSGLAIHLVSHRLTVRDYQGETDEHDDRQCKGGSPPVSQLRSDSGQVHRGAGHSGFSGSDPTETSPEPAGSGCNARCNVRGRSLDSRSYRLSESARSLMPIDRQDG